LPGYSHPPPNILPWVAAGALGGAVNSNALMPSGVYVDRPMTAVEVQAEMERLIAEAEEETGIATIEGLSHKERIRNLIVSEQPLPPKIYQIAYNRGETVN
jgi:hypothetical protein